MIYYHIGLLGDRFFSLLLSNSDLFFCVLEYNNQ